MIDREAENREREDYYSAKSASGEQSAWPVSSPDKHSNEPTEAWK